MAVFFICAPLHIENCDSNSRLVVDEVDYLKFRFKRVLKLDSLKHV